MKHWEDIECSPGNWLWQCEKCGEDFEEKEGVNPKKCPYCNSIRIRARTGPWVYFPEGKFNPVFLAQDLREDIPFLTQWQSQALYRYEDGVYKPDGEQLVKQKVAEILGDLQRKNYVAETMEALRNLSFRKFDNNGVNSVCLANGILDLQTVKNYKYIAPHLPSESGTVSLVEELRAHTPDEIFFSRIPANYDPDAVCPYTLKRMWEWTGGDMRSMMKLIQFAGFCLYRDYFLRKALIVYGEGGNGKTTFIEFLNRWLGEENISHLNLQELSQRFASAQIYEKLANTYDDLPHTSFFDSGKFKLMTGGGTIEGEFKFKHRFSFRSYAKLIFAANRLPEVDEDTEAFWDRIILVNFPSRWISKQKDREEILERMLTPEERSGFLNLAILGLFSLQADQHFYAEDTLDEIKEKYIQISDPIMAFAHQYIERDPDPNGKISKREVYQTYIEYCAENGFPAKENNSFSRSLKRMFPEAIDDIAKIEGKSERVWRGIRLKNQKESESEDEKEEVIRYSKDTYLQTSPYSSPYETPWTFDLFNRIKFQLSLKTAEEMAGEE